MNRPAGLLQRLARITPLVVITMAFSPLATAETVYVTDELRLGLYDTEQTSGRPFKSLTSGDSLVVLERALMSIRVRTEAGEEGWVKTAYIVSEEPGRRRAAKLEASNSQLEAQLAEAETEISSSQDRIDGLEASLAAANAAIDTLPELQANNAELTAQLDQSGSRIPSSWAVITGITALICGFALGYFWLDRRVRRHFGGVRVY